MLLVVDPYYGELGGRLALLSGFDLVVLEHKRFPDGELYFRIVDDVAGKEICLLMGCGVFGQSDCVLRVLFLVRTLKDLGAKRVFLVLPYFPYARQDKRFLPGECVSARVLGEVFSSVGADVIATVDVHSPGAFAFLGDKFVNLDSIPVWTEFFKRGFGREFFLISPDEGRLEVVERLARALGVQFTGFKKVRDLKSGKIIGLEPMDVEYLRELSSSYNVAVLFDDIISTGGTAARVISLLRKHFTGKIVAAFTHGLFLPGSTEKLVKAGVSDIVATDTVRNAFAKVSVAPLLLTFLKSL